MVTFNRIQAQLVKVDAVFASLGITDVKSLARILKHDEQIVSCLRGVYAGAPALLCATDARLLLLRSNKRSTHINELSYDSVTETRKVDRRWHSYIHVGTKDTVYVFKTVRKHHTNEVYTFIVRHAEHARLSAPTDDQSRYSLPKKFAHYTHVKSMKDLGDLALLSMIH